VNPFQAFRLRENVPGHRDAEGHEDVDVGYGFASLRNRTDRLDRQVWKAGMDQVFIAMTNGGRPGQQDEDGGSHWPKGSLFRTRDHQRLDRSYLLFSQKSRQAGSK
jgi:hypothetical protein